MKNKRGASDGGTQVAYGDTVALVIAAVLAVTMFWVCVGVRTVYTTIVLVVLVIGEATLILWRPSASLRACPERSEGAGSEPKEESANREGKT